VAGVPLYATSVRPEWVDYNGHLRDAFYVLIASLATDALMERIGLDAAYRERTGGTLYTVELHVHYLHEVKAADRVSVQLRVLAFDAKRLHLLLELHRVAEPVLCAAVELLLLHVEQTAPGVRSAPLPAASAAALAGLQAAAASLPQEAPASRRIELRRPPPA
jgi:acyl-CoA thioester hydrolase